MCKTCHVLLVPGVTAIVRSKSKEQNVIFVLRLQKLSKILNLYVEKKSLQFEIHFTLYNLMNCVALYDRW